MKSLCRLAASLVSLAALIGPAICQPAPTYQVGAPVASNNLSIYFVHGNGSGGAAPLTLDQAVASGQARVNWQDGGPFTVENFSDHAIFVPFGMLLAGGLQDQVTSTSLLVPPHSGPTSLATFCVDPFRSTARDKEDPKTLLPTDTVIPSRIAKLAMLTKATDIPAVGTLRQASVWWSIDTTRTELSQSLGVAVEPPYQPHWASTEFQDHISNPVLADRRSTWTTSLPLALEKSTLRQAEQAYANALTGEAAGVNGETDIIGAVFAVSGNIEGAEIYQSHGLFAAMWPKLLRSYVIAAVATAGADATAAPSVEEVSAFLASAKAGTARGAETGFAIRDSADAIYAETTGNDGDWINRSFVATAIPSSAAASPETMLLGMIEAGEVNGRSTSALRDRDLVVLHRQDAGWSATIQPRADDILAQLELALSSGFGSRTANSAQGGSSLPGFAISVVFFATLFWLIFPRRPRRRPAFARAPQRRRLQSVAMTMKAFAAFLVAMVRLALTTAGALAAAVARRATAAWAAWPPEGLVSAIAILLGPAWPGNFRAPSRRFAAPPRK